MSVPFPHPGFMRKVYPGFLQLSGFMSMNFDRHVTAHQDFFSHLVDGDGDSAEKHREFYDEYLSVHGPDRRVLSADRRDRVRAARSAERADDASRPAGQDRKTIRHTALLTVEGERDDISGVGQTKAAHALCTNLSYDKKQHFLAMGVGHYGVFNGSRFRSRDRAAHHRLHRRSTMPAPTRRSGAGRSRSTVTADSFEKRLADATGVTALAGKNLTDITEGITQELTEIAGIGPKMMENLNELGDLRGRASSPR